MVFIMYQYNLLNNFLPKVCQIIYLLGMYLTIIKYFNFLLNQFHLILIY